MNDKSQNGASCNLLDSCSIVNLQLCWGHWCFERRLYNNNNNNNNTQDNVYSAVIMTKSFREFTQFIWWMWFGASWLPTLRPSQSTWAVSPPVGCHSPHPPSPFIIITQPEGWYSFYHPTEGRRLSRPSWLVTYLDGLPTWRWSPIQVLTGPDVG